VSCVAFAFALEVRTQAMAYGLATGHSEFRGFSFSRNASIARSRMRERLPASPVIEAAPWDGGCR
jgi:hypothetical protein